MTRRTAQDDAGSSGDEVRIGISSCLLGESVRYDGGHKHDRFLTGTVGPLVRFVPVCPEVELGLGVPRPSLRLVAAAPGDAAGLRLVVTATGEDWTARMQRFAARRVRQLEQLDLDGYLLKKDSPSCGLERVKVHRGAGAPARDGRGLFAAALVERLPLLPVEEEGRLHDPVLRDNFFVRVFAARRLKRAFHPRWRLAGLVGFHAGEKLLLMAHEPEGYRALGRLVAAAKSQPRAEVARTYAERFMRALARPASRGRHVNVLQHALGFFRERLDADSRAELAASVEDFRRGLVPLIVPVTLVRHHARRFGVDWLLQQSWLSPHPKELMLRNHV